MLSSAAVPMMQGRRELVWDVVQCLVCSPVVVDVVEGVKLSWDQLMLCSSPLI